MNGANPGRGPLPVQLGKTWIVYILELRGGKLREFPRDLLLPRGRPVSKVNKLPLIFGAVGAAFLAVAIPLWLRERAFEKRAIEADAVVVSTDQPIWSRQARATVEFAAGAEGPVVSARVYASGSFEKFTVGERIRVRFDPQAPQSAAIAGSLRGWVLPIVFGVLGSLFALASLVVAVIVRRSLKNA